jgi:LmbE family N-acetylglucosaminyl deacetylase
MFATNLQGLQRILCLGAHADDIEIGCGGAVQKLLLLNPDLHVDWVVFSAIGPRRGEAEKAAEKILHNAASCNIEVLEFEDTSFPFAAADIKRTIAELAHRVRPDLIFSHRLEDRHQDHRLLAEYTWNCFRNHLILEYEIAKYEGDLGQPNLYLPLTVQQVDRKVSVLSSCFLSQQDKHWFSDETFRSLMRIRGLECHAESGYAEAFYCRKLVI